MSNIPYPPDFEIDYHSAHHEERRQRALKALTVSDVLSELDDLIAAEPDPAKHPAFGLVAFLLDRQTAVDGGALYDHLRHLAWTAIDRLVEARLQGED
jgi:hypothetical protein